MFARFLGKWWRSFLSLTNRQAGIYICSVERMDILGKRPILNFFLALEHGNSSISNPAVFGKKAIIKNFAKFTVKHLCWSFLLAALRVWELFSGEFWKTLGITILKTISSENGCFWNNLKKAIPISSKTGQPISTIWRPGKKTHLSNRNLPVVASEYVRDLLQK